jgi:hypothetical protein
LVGVIALALVAIAIEEGVQAWSGWSERHAAIGTVGVQYAVTLVSSQVFFGKLDRAITQFITISNVHYVQTGQPDAQGKREVKLVSRKKSDWHEPDFAVIPIDKILFMEAIGADSPVTRAMAEDAIGPSK